MYNKLEYNLTDDMAVEVDAMFHKENKVEPVHVYLNNVKCKVKVIEVTQCGTLKKRGMGLRYKAYISGEDFTTESYLFRIGDFWYLAENIDTIPDIQTRHAGFDYSGKKIIDDRYDNPHKTAVDVLAAFHVDGEVEPYTFWWKDGAEYQVDKMLEKERAASLKAGIIGLRYKILVRGKETYLFRDDDLWFMENKEDYRVLDVHGRPLE